jgi:hypothetical protein
MARKKDMKKDTRIVDQGRAACLALVGDDEDECDVF